MPLRCRPRILLLRASRLSFVAFITGSARCESPTQLDEFFVTGQRVAALSIVVPRDDLRPPEPNFGPELLAIPGVYGQARAADAMEPSIRGLGLDRVATTLNGIPLVNASPERTHSPVVVLGASEVAQISVTKALPSVTLGPVTTGGQIAIETDGGAIGGPSSSGGRLTTTFNGARDGVTMTGRVAAGAGAWSATASFFANDLNNYRGADGREVAARFSDHGGSTSLAWQTDTQRTRIEILTRRLRREDTIALPLDGKNTESRVLTFNQHWSISGGGPLQTIDLRGGAAYTDPYITSENRVSAPITAQATARSGGGGLTTSWRVSTAGTLAAGGDIACQRRRAIRTTAAGQDYIWPNVQGTDVGAFAEWTQPLGSHLKMRWGARVDDVHSDADDADKLALGKTIREQYVAYNGAAAAGTARHDQVGASNLLLRWAPTPAFALFAGAGYSVQPAQVMERYRAFLNALGGDGRGGNAVELGNPSLNAERKTTLEAGVALHRERIDIEATVYWYTIDDFILRTLIGTTNPPLAKMVVFGYRNQDADLFGAEARVVFQPAPNWSLPLSIAVADGKDRTTGRGLADLPPVEGNLALRFRTTAGAHPWAVEFGGRFVAAKNNPAPRDNPLFVKTGGFSVWHLRTGISLSARTRVELGCENLLDRRYSEYLTPPVAPVRPASGSLLPGEHVPMPGHSLWAALTLTW